MKICKRKNRKREEIKHDLLTMSKNEMVDCIIKIKGRMGMMIDTNYIKYLNNTDIFEIKKQYKHYKDIDSHTCEYF